MIKKIKDMAMRLVPGTMLCTALLGSCMLLGSCIREQPVEPGPPPGRDVTVEILLHTPDAAPRSRAMTDADETTVRDVYVVFFHGGQVYTVSEGHEVAATADGDAGKTLSFQTSFSVESNYADEEFECVVLTNVGDVYDLAAARAWRNRTYDGLQAELSQAVPDRMYATAAGPIPMWGRAKEKLVPSTPNQRLSVSLLRCVARVDVAVGADAQAAFTLQEVHIYKPNDRLALMPLATAYETSDLSTVTKPSVPAGTAPAADPWKYEVSGTGIDRAIYLPEADVLMKGQNGGTGQAGDNNHTNRSAIVVGGMYKEAMNYYRIDFKTGGATPALMDVLRNHRYNVTITAVRGGGEATPDEAYRARSADIAAEIVTWTDNNQNIVFDGEHWASCGSKNLTFLAGAALSSYLAFGSDMAAADWEIRLSQAFPAPDTTPDEAFSKEATVTGTWFEVTRPAKNEGGYFIVKTLQELHPDQGKPGEAGYVEGDPERTEILTVRIGRLTVEITLRQVHDPEDPWQDGGEFEGSLS